MEQLRPFQNKAMSEFQNKDENENENKSKRENLFVVIVAIGAIASLNKFKDLVKAFRRHGRIFFIVGLPS